MRQRDGSELYGFVFLVERLSIRDRERPEVFCEGGKGPGRCDVSRGSFGALGHVWWGYALSCQWLDLLVDGEYGYTVAALCAPD